MLEKKIKKLTNGVYPFHMPGHKRREEWLEGLNLLDITEIVGADDLNAPSGIIKDAQECAAELFKVFKTFFLTGGSTCGILSAISAVSGLGDKIIIPRNCHKSVYNAVLLNRLNPYYILPDTVDELNTYGAVSAESVANAMEKSQAKIVVITSPTYEGIVSDIKSIAEEVHSRNGILIVDSAHGAHLGFSENFPKSARNLGADIVIESAHKTLPCLTGGAFLHICSNRVCPDLVKEKISLFQTSSPPFPIICSLDRFVSKAAAQDLFSEYKDLLCEFRDSAKKWKVLKLFTGGYDFDGGKLVISCKNANITGFELKNLLLKKYKIELEMAMPDYLLAMTSIADTKEGFNRLSEALYEIDKSLCLTKKDTVLLPEKTISRLPLSDAQDRAKNLVLPCDAVGKICGEFIYAYPPGSPIIAPGEEVTPEILSYLSGLYSSGGQVISSKGFFPEKIAIIVD